MEELVEKFIEWWKAPNEELADILFHEKLYVRDCALNNAKYIWLNSNSVPDLSDLKILKSFSTDNEASIILEQTDEITGLYYRHAVYLQSSGGKITEIVSTKESVANENKL